jgi:hypothetical protein
MKIISSKKQSKIAQSPGSNKIDARTRHKIYSDLKAAGLDGNGRFPESDSGVSLIWKILEPYGMNLDTLTKDLFIGDEGNRTFTIYRKDPSQNAFTQGIELSNMISYSWSKRHTGQFEILAYLT